MYSDLLSETFVIKQNLDKQRLTDVISAFVNTKRDVMCHWTANVCFKSDLVAIEIKSLLTAMVHMNVVSFRSLSFIIS